MRKAPEPLAELLNERAAIPLLYLQLKTGAAQAQYQEYIKQNSKVLEAQWAKQDEAKEQAA